MFYNMRWNPNYEPTLENMNYLESDRMHVEVLMSRAPEVRILSTMDVSNFDFNSSNYRLEYTIMLFLTMVCIIVTCFLLTANMQMYKLSDAQRTQLSQYEETESDEMKRLKVRKAKFEMVKEKNK